MTLSKQHFQNIYDKLMYKMKDFPYLPRWVVLGIDLMITIFAFMIAGFLDYYTWKGMGGFCSFSIGLIINTAVSLFFFIVFKPYSGIIRYSTIKDSIRVFWTAISSFIFMSFVGWVISGFTFILYKQIIFINSFLFAFCGMYLFRVVVREIYDWLGKSGENANLIIPILIFDISPSTVAIAGLIKNTPSSPYRLLGFVTSKEKENNKSILNVPVFCKENRADMIKIKKLKPQPKALLINPEEQGRSEKQAISDYCEKNKWKLLAFPSANNWNNGNTVIDKIKDIQIEELLGRVPIQISTEKIAADLTGKCIMVTGAAGSIGSEIVRQIGHFKPQSLLLCDIAETPLHLLRLELEEKYPDLKFFPLICDVRNSNRLEKIFEEYRPAHIYHAAAYKHVPLMEDHPSEAIYTNVIGTKNVVDLAIKYEAEAFVMISTDKAVNPTNVMGAAKRIAEIYVQSLYKEIEHQKSTRIITTRFGNVLGSNGSVIPRFKEQIAKGGPITVTHPDIIRYFMTIPEACRLVLEAANMGNGGEIFVFDMGSPVKIIDLAAKMIHLAGLKPDDIKIKFTGLRPGEKLYEELLANEEATKPTHNKKIMIGTVRDNYEYKSVLSSIDELRSAVKNYEDNKILKIMHDLVPEYQEQQ